MNEAPPHPTGGVPLLETKLFVPRRRPDLVSRPRLIERLHRGSEGKLTLVSAPAGFGKTTLLSAWLATRERESAGWVALDASDNDPNSFWSYVIAAVERTCPEAGERAHTLLLASQAIESVLTALINDVSASEERVVLVLDDYHVIERAAIDQGLAFLLDHLPPQMHLALASRSDPALPLARLRTRGQMMELRAADLRFTPDETAAFLNEVMGLDLAASDVAALEQRTEGWIAALQLAALSMQGRDDTEAFLTAFSGNHRYVADYLVEEVLQRQTERVRTFLLQASVLDRLSGPLCDAVTGQQESQALLEALERRNLFVVPLDDRRRWYRFHNLFADVLQARLWDQHPDLLPELHRRASTWYEVEAAWGDAVGHALAAEDYERAARLIEQTRAVMSGTQRSDTWLGWVRALPEEWLRDRPMLSLGYAWALLYAGELEAGKARLSIAEQWLERIDDAAEFPDRLPDGMVVVTEEGLQSLPGSIASARAYCAQAVGDADSAIRHARRALDLLPESDHVRRRGVVSLLGFAYWTRGDLEAAHRTFADALVTPCREGHAMIVVGISTILTDIQLAQGRLRAAVKTCEAALQRARDQDDEILPGTMDLYVELSEVRRRRGDLDGAEAHLLTATELGARGQLAGVSRSRWHAVMAHLRHAQGRLQDALDLLEEAERLAVRTPFPDVRPLPALRARVWLAQGRIADAQEWVRESGLSADDELSYVREFEHVTLARVLLARHAVEGDARHVHQAVRLLERLAGAAGAGGRRGRQIEVLVLQARAHQALDDPTRARGALEQALALAEVEEHVQVFVAEGEPMRDLLRQAADAGNAYARHVLRAFAEQAESALGQTPAAAGVLLEPLTAREHEILLLVAEGLKNQQIADRLFISLSTVKGHISNLYGKMEVSRRTEAVARAREIGLL